MRVRIILLLTSCVVLLHATTSFAQTKSKSTFREKTPPKDTVVIIKDEEDVDTPKPVVKPRTDMKTTVITIKPSDTLPKKRATYKDTVIILKKGLSKEELAKRAKVREEKMMKENNFCDCVKMDIKAPDVLPFETYLNYSFVFKNDCKVEVWVSSKHFRFRPANSSGTPVKVLRKLSFVERFDKPDFVKLAPGESYSFDYSDDAFFEYDLRKGQAYKFMFEHRNFGDRNKQDPSKTYLCSQKRVQLIVVQ
ncbi:MAG: hypothetical protein KDC11_02570 [Chitinophagaceae bacterium]|nr:hypothetical protein [Chitinophagaceae bacterium]